MILGGRGGGGYCNHDPGGGGGGYYNHRGEQCLSTMEVRGHWDESASSHLTAWCSSCAIEFSTDSCHAARSFF